MPALVFDLVVEQGTSWTHGFLPMLADVPLLAEAGWTGRAQVRRTAGSADVLWEWSDEQNNLHIDAETGALSLTVSPAESQAWTWKYGVYDLEVTNSDGSVEYRIAQGVVRVHQEVTR